MSGCPELRYVIVPTDRGDFDVYADGPEGLTALCGYRSLDEALAYFPAARIVRQLWDAPIIDPADPETWPEELRRPQWP